MFYDILPYFIAVLVIGIIIGVIIGNTVHKPEYAGLLVVDNSDEDGPYLFLEIEDGDVLDRAIHSKVDLMFHVVRKNYISQK